MQVAGERHLKARSNPSSPLRRLLMGLVMLLVACVAALVFAKPLLNVERGPAKTEVIVVLGGEATLRAERALECFNASGAPAIIISGDGHKGDIETYLLAHGCPSNAISLE